MIKTNFLRMSEPLFTALDKCQMTKILGGKLANTRSFTGHSSTYGQTDGGGVDCWDTYSDLIAD